eukprot:gnl/MRDRNA2_/MRDRNA2_159245_c0_seq1.p1 gnl/MRDRNA2_/MRDRNA2_159245_c0~~gnl/MRDRNA2_/MRDRNA2_159245_c0_seq1.p1  ORF type:complete len:166 (-),score=13.35 gnl/MRDRNA2_/MRDRNA2_159245_c0_seq1:62-493(-)
MAAVLSTSSVMTRSLWLSPLRAALTTSGMSQHRNLVTLNTRDIPLYNLANLPPGLLRLKNDNDCRPTDLAKAMERIIGPENVVRSKKGTFIFKHHDKQFTLPAKTTRPLNKDSKVSAFNAFIHMGMLGSPKKVGKLSQGHRLE